MLANEYGWKSERILAEGNRLDSLFDRYDNMTRYGKIIIDIITWHKHQCLQKRPTDFV